MMTSKDEASAVRQFLVERPGPDAEVRNILCLDFDGVINILGGSFRDKLPQARRDGQFWGICLDADVVAGLDTVLQRNSVWLAWTTTWGSEIALVQDLFDGHLAGGFVSAEPPPGVYVDMGWKERAVRRLTEQFPQARLAWVDDEAVPVSFRSGAATRDLPDALLIAPNPLMGLQPVDITAIGDFFTDAGGTHGHSL